MQLLSVENSTPYEELLTTVQLTKVQGNPDQILPGRQSAGHRHRAHPGGRDGVVPGLVIPGDVVVLHVLQRAGSNWLYLPIIRK